MAATAAEVLAGRWRRLDDAMERARAAPASHTDELADAAVAALHAMYDMWELWRRSFGGKPLTRAEADQRVDGDADGETAAALISARGGGTHELLEIAENAGFGRQPFGVTSFGGGWYWREYLDSESATRAGWYGQRVKWHAVLEPLEAAYRWFTAQPEIPHP